VNKEKLKKELVEISEMEDNWDGYEAPSFTKEIIDKIDIIIDCLDDKYPTPDLVPSPIGIQLEWDRSKKKGELNYLEISVDDDKILYIQGFGMGIQGFGMGMHDFDDKNISDLSEINELLESFYGEEK